jgi:hypothetical protein
MEQYASSAYVAHVEKDEEPEPEPEPTTGLFALLEKLWEWLMGLFS